MRKPDAKTPSEPEPNPLLGAVPAAVRERLLALGVRHVYRPGEVVVLQDEACAGLFFVQRGVIKVSKFSAEGREQVLRFVPAGGAFNEVAVLDGGANPATATAIEDSELLAVPREAMLRLITETPGLAGTMVESLAGRLRHLVMLVEDLSFRHVSERVARILLQSVTPHSGVGAGVSFDRRVTQQELAEMAGTSREVVSRALRTLEASGAILIEQGEIRLIAPEKLSSLS